MYIYDEVDNRPLKEQIYTVKKPEKYFWETVDPLDDFNIWLKDEKDVIAKIVCQDGIIYVVRMR